MLKIRLGKSFNFQYQALIKNNKKIKEIVITKINQFRNNPHDTRLRNHALTKRLNGKWAFSITSDIRIIYEWVGENTIRFLAIGTHMEVYNKK